MEGHGGGLTAAAITNRDASPACCLVQAAMPGRSGPRAYASSHVLSKPAAAMLPDILPHLETLRPQGGRIPLVTPVNSSAVVGGPGVVRGTLGPAPPPSSS